MTSMLGVCHLGPTPYVEGVRLQESLVAARAAGVTGDWLLYADHAPVITVGRSPSEGNVIASRETLDRMGIAIHEVARGGDVTWHGPGQLVGYTIVDLAARGRDLHRFLRDIEETLIRALAVFGIDAGRVPGRTGVWVEGAKIASIGIAVRRWVSYHGFALNVAPDLEAFRLIHPCGLHGIEMTSMRTLLGPDGPPMETVRERVAGEFAARLGYAGIERVDAAEAWRHAAASAA
jgi:lipoate-protein ligase B